MIATQEGAGVAVDILLRGYEEEINLYSALRELSLKQRESLRADADLARLCDLLDEKEDLVALIGEIDSEMSRAKSVVLSLRPHTCPHHDRLAGLLDHVAGLIADIRAIEQENMSFLDKVPA